MKNGLAALFAIWKRYRVVIGFLGALLCAYWCARGLIRVLPAVHGLPYQKRPMTVEMRADYVNADQPFPQDDDSMRVFQGFLSKPTFASTFKYWTGSWVQSELGPPTPFGPYYRPLTSQLWWLEQHFAGPNSLFTFLCIHLIWHFAFVIALWATLRLWWNDAGALLCLCVWAIGLPFFVNSYAEPFDALSMWKDDPEMGVGLCVLGAMAAARAFVRTNDKKYILWGLLAFALALSFKETGYVTPFFVAFAFWRFGANKTQWRIVPVFFAAAVFAAGYRTLVLHGLGGYHGTNASWLPRAISELIGGTISAQVWAGNSLGVALAAFILTVVYWLKTRRKVALFWLGIVVVACIWGHLNSPSSTSSLIEFFDVSLGNRIYSYLPSTLTMLVLWQLFILKRPPVMVWGWIWCLLAYLPLLKQSVTGHGFYFFSIGWALWFAGAFVEIAKYLQAAIIPRLRRIPALRDLQTQPL